MNWLWAYFRRKAMESIVAGVHDALVSGNGPSGLSDEEAVKALRAIIGGSDPAAAGRRSEGAAPSPPQLAAPEADGPPALTEAPRRGPGRPRKFQEPPQE